MALAEQSACLADSGGAPIWPVGSECDKAALTRTAGICCATLSWVQPARAVAAPCNTGELVIAVGPACRDAGRLYAHLTGRLFRCADDNVALMNGARPTVVVTAPDLLSPELLDWLYSGFGASAPGIVCGDPGDALMRQVLVRAAAASLVPCAPVPLRALFPTLALDVIRHAAATTMGGSSAVAERKALLSEGSGVLAVMTHADGVDAFLGPDLTGCPVQPGWTGQPRSGAPRCTITGLCHRHEVPVSIALESDSLAPPESMAAQVLVWDVCFGVLPAGSLVDRRWSFGRRLIESPSLGAILTNWQIVLSTPQHALGLATSISAGTPLGKALQNFNRALPHRDRSHRMCLLGDPRVRLPAAEALAAGVDGSAKDLSARGGGCDHRVVAPAAAGGLEGLAVLRLAMADAVAAAPSGPHAESAAKALAAVSAVVGAAARAPATDRLPEDLGDAMRGAVLDYAASRGKLLENWLPQVRRMHVLDDGTCPVCARRTDRIGADLISALKARWLELCPICGVLGDVPAGCDLGLELDRRDLALRGRLPQQGLRVGVVVASSYYRDTLRFDWMRASDGSLAREIRLPRRLPPGPLRLSAIVIWDDQFAVLSRMMRDTHWDRGPRPPAPN